MESDTANNQSLRKIRLAWQRRQALGQARSRVGIIDESVLGARPGGVAGGR